MRIIGFLFVLLADYFFYLKRKETGENCVQFFYVEHNYLSIKFHYTCLKLVGEKRTNVQSIYGSHALLFVCVWNVWHEKLPWRSRCVEDLCNIFTEVCCYTRMYSVKKYMYIIESQNNSSVSFSTGKLIRQVVRNGLQCLVSVTKSHRWDFGWDLSHLVYLAGQYFTVGARSCLKRHCDWQRMCVHVWPLPSGSLRHTLCDNCQTSNTELCLCSYHSDLIFRSVLWWKVKMERIFFS